MFEINDGHEKNMDTCSHPTRKRKRKFVKEEELVSA